MGTTYRAQDTAAERVVAVKELPLRPGTSAKHTELFEREARVLRQLDHPSIPKYLDHFPAGRGKHRALYLVQDFIDGEDLQASMDTHRYSAREVLQIIASVLPVLAYLHERSPPVLHRDLKPQNLIRTTAPDALFLVDFGSVRDALENEELGGSTVAGTFGFMAPEQFMGKASPATDLYGLGATAVALLVRQPLHTLLDTDRALNWRPHLQVSRPVADLLDDLLAADPANRPSSAHEVKTRIAALLDSDAPEAPADREERALAPVQDLSPVGHLQRQPYGYNHGYHYEHGYDIAYSQWVGAPTQISIDVTVRGRAGEDQDARMTALIESTMRGPGRVERSGDLFQWASAKASPRMVRISVLDLGHGTTQIKAWERMSSQATITLLMWTMGVGLVGMGLMPLIFRALGPGAAAVWVATAMALGYLVARSRFQLTHANRWAQLSRAVDDLTLLIEPETRR